MQTRLFWPLKRWLIAANISHNNPEKENSSSPFKILECQVMVIQLSVNYHSFKRNAAALCLTYREKERVRAESLVQGAALIPALTAALLRLWTPLLFGCCMNTHQ